MSIVPTAVLTVDLGALVANYKDLQTTAKSVVAVSVKANAYGLGVDQVAPALFDAGCRDFFVATIDEGMALRFILGPDACIYALGPVLTGNQAALIEHDLAPVLNSLWDIAFWKRNGNGHRCVIHFDTGINRLGLDADETEQLINDTAALDGLNVVLGISHFASSEDLNDGLNDLQIKRFRALTERLSLPQWSLCNSSGILRYPEEHYDMVRAGYALYGGNPLPHTANPMRPVVTLDARVLQTKAVRQGERAGYNGTHIFEHDDETATIALGYADGFPRSLSNAGTLYFEGQVCPVLGRISMDSTIIRIGHLAKKPRIGDLIEVLGPHQDIDALANQAGTNGYEIITRLGARYKRVYKN